MTYSNKIKWQSPSNIALIKYWGKNGNQLPNNASLSMTLKKSVTDTELSYFPSTDGMEVRYFFENERNEEFEDKVIRFFEKLKSQLTFLDDYLFEIRSSNTFPHSTGIASSASSMSALALCLVSMEQQLTGVELSEYDFLQRASHIARLGSGSASRSVYGGWVTWGTIDGIEDTSDHFASPLLYDIHEKFTNMGDAVLLVSSEKKSVSSSLGHCLMNIHPFAPARYEQATANLQALLASMQLGDFETFASVVENEALTLHALLMTSSADGLLLKPGSLQIIEAVRRFRKETGTDICFTLDAGPNMHLLYPISEKAKVLQFIQTELTSFCENGKWIDDETGDGPIHSK